MRKLDHLSGTWRVVQIEGEEIGLTQRKDGDLILRDDVTRYKRVYLRADNEQVDHEWGLVLTVPWGYEFKVGEVVAIGDVFWNAT